MKARLVAIHYSTGTHQRDLRLRDRLDERRPWNRFVHHPLVGFEVAVKFPGAWNVCDWHYFSSRISGSTSLQNRSNEARAFFGSSPGSCITTINSVIGVDSSISASRSFM